MENFVVIIILAVIVAVAVGYIVRAKKRGQACIGCPASKQCGGKCGCCDSKKNDSSEEQ